jgi:hypothetical protein
MPTFEQVASAPGLRSQVRQPSVHSRQSALGGLNGPALLVGVTARRTGNSVATATGSPSATAATPIVATVDTTDQRFDMTPFPAFEPFRQG